MSTELISQRYAGLDLWPTRDAVQAMLEGQLAAAAAVQSQAQAIAAAAEAAADRLRGDTGRLVYIGAGTSGRLAVQDGVELGPTYDWPEDRTLYLLAGGARGAEGGERVGRAAAGALAIGDGHVIILGDPVAETERIERRVGYREAPADAIAVLVDVFLVLLRLGGRIGAGALLALRTLDDRAHALPRLGRRLDRLDALALLRRYAVEERMLEGEAIVHAHEALGPWTHLLVPARGSAVRVAIAAIRALRERLGDAVARDPAAARLARPRRDPVWG